MIRVGVRVKDKVKYSIGLWCLSHCGACTHTSKCGTQPSTETKGTSSPPAWSERVRIAALGVRVGKGGRDATRGPQGSHKAKQLQPQPRLLCKAARLERAELLGHARRGMHGLELDLSGAAGQV